MEPDLCNLRGSLRKSLALQHFPFWQIEIETRKIRKPRYAERVSLQDSSEVPPRARKDTALKKRLGEGGWKMIEGSRNS